MREPRMLSLFDVKGAIDEAMPPSMLRVMLQANIDDLPAVRDEDIASLAAEVERLKAALRLCQPEFACLIRQTNAHPNGSVSRAYEAVLSALKDNPHAP